MSLAAGEIATDHQHLDQGHLTLNRGADALLVDAGGYDFSNSRYHNTFLIDDRGAGDVSVYPPSQGYWGIQAQLVKAGSGDGFAYGQADYGDETALTQALQGVEKLLIISSSEVGQRAPQHRNIIKAAKARPFNDG